jgi:PAS domain-containing protein
MITKSGVLKWISIGSVPTFSSNNIVVFDGVAFDITERKRMEEELKSSEERLKLATKAGNIGIWEWDIKSNTLVWDDILYEMHNVKKGEFAYV